MLSTDLHNHIHVQVHARTNDLPRGRHALQAFWQRFPRNFDALFESFQSLAYVCINVSIVSGRSYAYAFVCCLRVSAHVGSVGNIPVYAHAHYAHAGVLTLGSKLASTR